MTRSRSIQFIGRWAHEASIASKITELADRQERSRLKTIGIGIESGCRRGTEPPGAGTQPSAGRAHPGSAVARRGLQRHQQAMRRAIREALSNCIAPKLRSPQERPNQIGCDRQHKAGLRRWLTAIRQRRH